MSVFVPWQMTTIVRHRAALQGLMSASFLPERPDEGLGEPILTQAHESLQPSSPCRVCKLLFSLVSDPSTPVEFFEDYGCICLSCLYAPYCWTSILAVAADVCELLTRYFPARCSRLSVFGRAGLLGVDLQLHFFVQKCFRTTIPDKLIGASNLQFLKLEFLRGMVTGTLGGSFCFKTSWPRSDRDEPSANSPCCHILESHATEARRLPQEIQSALGGTNLQRKPALLSVVLHSWTEGSDLLDHDDVPKALETANTVPYLPICTPPPDTDGSQGPCLMHPTLGLRYKNGTSSVCLLCECLAAHPDAPRALLTLRREVLQNLENNVKLVDRIAFVLDGQDALHYVCDPILRGVILKRDPREIHKHLFCDPLCAINTRTVSEEVLFNAPVDSEYKKLRALVATGQLLDTNALFDCEIVQTLTILFKGLQNCRVGKTTACEILRELTTQLRKHGLDLAHPAQTVQIYV
ncbi:DNA packaging UL32 [Colobine gammaherpesvirus 1]|uniref:Packaging protein UL32 n=1 Tax=Colobine gammaherpesvirus 1 TaxID=2597325 RepID=A0A5B8G5G6_9GAMA|nr:DNA packaging UL32 [Colobine gammaherpesvirus 1]QDQ69280.1 DNA packaging UL32 [Colobine gammaherpesvirus 1]